MVKAGRQPRVIAVVWERNDGLDYGGGNGKKYNNLIYKTERGISL